MKSFKTISLILIAATIITSCNLIRLNEKQTNTEQMEPNIEEQTKAAFKGHIDGFMEGNITKMLSNWTEESIIIVGNKTYSGLEEIEGYLQGQISEFGQEGVDFKMGTTKFHENIAYITWSAITPINDYIYMLQKHT